MIHIRKSQERGHASHGWLDTYHTFSFADYYDPEHMGFSSLRVINDDRIAPGAGFPAHPHRDMEIITYVMEGALAHKDSMGNGSVIRRGDVQRMSAGSGITHSEFNASNSDPIHLLQIWLMPEKNGITPGYEQKFFPDTEKQGKLHLVASRDGRDGSVTMHQNASLYACLLQPGESVIHSFKTGRKGYLHLASGEIELNGIIMHGGDGARITDESEIRLSVRQAAELLLFDLM